MNPTPLPPDGLTDLLADGLASLDARDRLASPNRAMRELLAAAAAAGVHAPDGVDLAALGVDEPARAALTAGRPATLAFGGRVWQLRMAELGGGRWLVASEVTWRDTALSTVLAHQRARRLGGMAAAIVHDLSNLLGAGLGLAGMLRPLARDPADAELIAELEAGTRQGALLARGIARLLSQPGPLQRLDVAPLVAGLMAVVGKTAAIAKVELTSTVAPGAPALFAAEAEALQALLDGVLFLLDRGARRLVVAAAECADAVRGRPAVAITLTAQTVAAGTASAARRVVEVDDGWTLRDVRLATGDALFTAAVALRRGGGALSVAGDDGELRLVYAWPARSG